MLWNAYSEDGSFPPRISVISAGHIFAENSRCVQRTYGRDDWLIFYVASGAEEFMLPSREVAGEGSFVIYRPGEAQIHTTVSQRAEFYYAHFTSDESFSDFGLQSSVIYNSEPSAQIPELFEKLIVELQLKNELYPIVCASRLAEIVCLLKRKSENASTHRLDEHGKIAFAVQYIHNNYSEHMTLGGYAALCGMSKFHFLRRFEDVTGTSPIAYRNRLRLLHAREMLADGGISVAEVAASVGFSSQSYFSDAYKKEFGIPPKSERVK